MLLRYRITLNRNKCHVHVHVLPSVHPPPPTSTRLGGHPVPSDAATSCSVVGSANKISLKEWGKRRRDGSGQPNESSHHLHHLLFQPQPPSSWNVSSQVAAHQCRGPQMRTWQMAQQGTHHLLLAYHLWQIRCQWIPLSCLVRKVTG
jgi:hypothetical protein